MAATLWVGCVRLGLWLLPLAWVRRITAQAARGLPVSFAGFLNQGEIPAAYGSPKEMMNSIRPEEESAGSSGCWLWENGPIQFKQAFPRCLDRQSHGCALQAGCL